MFFDWGPHYIVPSQVFESYSGTVMLREEFDEALLRKELNSIGIEGHIERVVHPWYYRKKGSGTWIMVGQSDEIDKNVPVKWNTAGLENGRYEGMGLMHVFLQDEHEERAVARQNVVEVSVEN